MFFETGCHIVYACKEVNYPKDYNKILIITMYEQLITFAGFHMNLRYQVFFCKIHPSLSNLNDNVESTLLLSRKPIEITDAQ